MLQHFFENTEYTPDRETHKAFFEGLAIMQAGDEYVKHMGKYPVISLSLKSAKQQNYKEAFACLREVIAKEYGRYEYVVKRSLQDTEDYNRYRRIRNQEDLIAGGTIEKPVHENITYEDVYASQDNLWNFLYQVFTVPLSGNGLHRK